jgi:hypothetical protein
MTKYESENKKYYSIERSEKGLKVITTERNALKAFAIMKFKERVAS